MRSAPVRSFSKAQRPVESSESSQRLRIAGVCILVARCRVSTTSPRAGGGSASGLRLPDQRQGLGEVADIVVGEAEQLLADLLLAKAAQQSGFGRREIEPAGQGRQRPAAVGIGRLAQIGLDQPKLGVARGLEGERVEEAGEGLHQASSSSSRPLRCSASASMPIERA